MSRVASFVVQILLDLLVEFVHKNWPLWCHLVAFSLLDSLIRRFLQPFDFFHHDLRKFESLLFHPLGPFTNPVVQLRPARGHRIERMLNNTFFCGFFLRISIALKSMPPSTVTKNLKSNSSSAPAAFLTVTWQYRVKKLFLWPCLVDFLWNFWSLLVPYSRPPLPACTL